jgi:hypothetical protein
LPLLALRHFACQSRQILPDAAGLAQTQCSCGLADNHKFRKTRNQLFANATEPYFATPSEIKNQVQHLFV